MEVKKHRFPYEWKISEAKFTKDKGSVFSCFACGGGSSFGYKLAGFDVIGCNEIDPKMMEAYKANHNPKYAYLEPIQTFKLRKDLPDELYNLDILDGSPPCSSFSMAGNREKDWGKEKKFREGQAEQILDNLFFDFIDLAKELQPKVVIAENVKGLLMGDAIEYVRKIYREFDLAGYYCQHWLLDASKMGVPQRRERVFFVCLRKDLAEPFLKQMDLFTVAPELKLQFNEPNILFRNISDNTDIENKLTDLYTTYWRNAKQGGNVGKQESCRKVYLENTCNTITSGSIYHPVYERELNENEIIKAGSFPNDYNFDSNIVANIRYLIGMSVPPVMTAQIATEIYNQWLNNI